MQPVEELEFHPFCRLGAFPDRTQLIVSGWKVMLKHLLSRPPHICQDRLLEVPSQKSIRRPSRILNEVIGQPFGHQGSDRTKNDYFVTLLSFASVKRNAGLQNSIHTSGLMDSPYESKRE